MIPDCIFKLFDNFRQNSKNMEFDFQDEPEQSAKFGTPNRTPKALSSTKKKATTFSQIMDKMKKNHGTPK